MGEIVGLGETVGLEKIVWVGAVVGSGDGSALACSSVEDDSSVDSTWTGSGSMFWLQAARENKQTSRNMLRCSLVRMM